MQGGPRISAGALQGLKIMASENAMMADPVAAGCIMLYHVVSSVDFVGGALSNSIFWEERGSHIQHVDAKLGFVSLDVLKRSRFWTLIPGPLRPSEVYQRQSGTSSSRHLDRRCRCVMMLSGWPCKRWGADGNLLEADWSKSLF